jgi:hypothetical protein
MDTIPTPRKKRHTCTSIERTRGGLRSSIFPRLALQLAAPTAMTAGRRAGTKDVKSLCCRIRQPQARWQDSPGSIVCSGHPGTREGRAAARSQQGAVAFGFTRAPSGTKDLAALDMALLTQSSSMHGRIISEPTPTGREFCWNRKVPMDRMAAVASDGRTVGGSCIDPSMLPFRGNLVGRLGRAHRAAAPPGNR